MAIVGDDAYSIGHCHRRAGYSRQLGIHFPMGIFGDEQRRFPVGSLDGYNSFMPSERHSAESAWHAIRVRDEMTKPPKRPRDLNQWAKHMVDLATGGAGKREHASA